MRKHFELTEETGNFQGRTLHRIRALVDLPYHNIKAGDLGGFVEGEHNLCDEAWVADNAIVCDNAALHRRSRAENYALVMGDASAWGSALIKDHATVSDFALVNQDATISDYARVSEFARVLWEAKVGGHASLKGHATATEFARVSGWVKMRGFSKARDCAKISGFAEMDDHAQARGDAIATGLSYLSGSDEIGKGGVCVQPRRNSHCFAGRQRVCFFNYRSSSGRTQGVLKGHEFCCRRGRDSFALGGRSERRGHG